MGTDANGYPIFVVGAGPSSASFSRNVYGVRLNTSTGAFTVGTALTVLTPASDRHIRVTGNTLGGNQYPYPDGGVATADTQAVPVSKTGTEEFDGTAAVAYNSTLYQWRIYVRNDTLAVRAPVSRVATSDDWTIGSSNYDAFCTSGDNWVMAWQDGANIRMWKSEGTSMSARGSSLSTSGSGLSANTGAAFRVFTASPPGGRAGMLAMKRGSSNMQFMAVDAGTGTTGAWSGIRYSAVQNYATASTDSINPTIARLRQSKVIHGVKSSTNFYYYCTDITWGNEATWSTTTTDPTISNSAESSTSYQDGVQFIDSSTIDKAYMLRYIASTKTFNITPITVSGTTMTTATETNITTTSTFSEFGEHSGLTRYGDWIIGVAHDGTNAKLFALKKN
jgi:hypothetical protein